jgi:hypothetical protein
LIPRLIALNCLNFDYVECAFTLEDKREDGGPSTALPINSEFNKEGSGRVCFYKELGIVNCYTLECNY